MSSGDIKADTKNQSPIALTIAGSDSGGGAGIQADLKTFFSLGVHGTSVVTAVTAQNTLGVAAWQAVASSLIVEQLAAVIGDLTPAAIKTGMLGDAMIVELTGKHLKNKNIPLIVDPVLVASSGDALTRPDAIEAYLDHLFPLASLITPNQPEAEALTGLRITNDDEALQAASRLLESGCGAVLLKGGHGSGEFIEDLLLSRHGSRKFRHSRLDGVYHGTGCTLSAAITARVAAGKNLEDAVADGIDFVIAAMEAADQAGSGSLKVLKPPAGNAAPTVAR